MNPYRRLPASSFWKKAVTATPWFDIDPMVNASFKIARTDRVATAGSCFAQHIARKLSNSGFNYFVTETAPPGMPRETAVAMNFGTYSARFGNLYTARQLKQLWMQAMEGVELGLAPWHAPDTEGYIDPLRPQIQPTPFADVASLDHSRRLHLECCRKMFSELDVFVFTLGLTESWIDTKSGAALPLAPGVAGGVWDNSAYNFVNFKVNEVIDDMNYVISGLRSLNPNAKVILTVSPVPLIATYEPRHVLCSTVYSKSVLRVAAEELAGLHKGYVDYFPSFEIITGPATAGKYFEGDLRSISPLGVNHVMRTFFRHYAANDQDSVVTNTVDLDRERREVSQIVCDEEAIDRS
jgi:hypothetical protein